MDLNSTFTAVEWKLNNACNPKLLMDDVALNWVIEAQICYCGEGPRGCVWHSKSRQQWQVWKTHFVMTNGLTTDLSDAKLLTSACSVGRHLFHSTRQSQSRCLQTLQPSAFLFVCFFQFDFVPHTSSFFFLVKGDVKVSEKNKVIPLSKRQTRNKKHHL